MKGSRCTEEQIVRILREVESGTPILEACRTYGVSEATVHRWRGKNRGMHEAQLHRLKELEMETLQLRKIVAQQALDIYALKYLLVKGLVSLSARRQGVRVLLSRRIYLELGGCALVGIPRPSFRYTPRPWTVRPWWWKRSVGWQLSTRRTGTDGSPLFSGGRARP